MNPGRQKMEKVQGRPIEILAIEDCIGDTILLKETLKSSKFVTRMNVIRDGESALAYLGRLGASPSSPFPDLILLDLALPKTSGHEVLLGIKRNRRLNRIPVLVLTNSDEDADRLKAHNAHVDAYLLKPRDLFRYGELLEYLEKNWLKDVYVNDQKPN